MGVYEKPSITMIFYAVPTQKCTFNQISKNILDIISAGGLSLEEIKHEIR